MSESWSRRNYYGLLAQPLHCFLCRSSAMPLTVSYTMAHTYSPCHTLGQLCPTLFHILTHRVTHSGSCVLHCVTQCLLSHSHTLPVSLPASYTKSYTSSVTRSQKLREAHAHSVTYSQCGTIRMTHTSTVPVRVSLKKENGPSHTLSTVCVCVRARACVHVYVCVSQS